MGTTYVTGKKVNVFFDDKGTAYYMLGEATYTRDSERKEGRWEVYYFGTLVDCIAYMVWASQFTEGGITAGHAKTPEKAIELWFNELAHPSLGECRVLSYDLKPMAWEKEVLSQPMLDDVNAILRKHGQPEADGTTVTLDMSRPGCLAAMAEMFRGEYAAHPSGIRRKHKSWPSIHRFCKGHHLRFGEAMPGCGVEVSAPKGVTLDGVQVFFSAATPDDQHYLVTPEGMKATGWAYSTMGAFIEGYVLQKDRAMLEGQRGGQVTSIAIGAIKAFRKLMKAKAELPDDTIVRVNPETMKGWDAWHLKNFEKLAGKFGVPADQGMETTMGEWRRRGMESELQGVLAEAVSYELKAAREATLFG